MTTSASILDRLEREQPEWGPWLAVIEEVVREAGSRRWAPAVPSDLTSPHAAAPLLARATFTVQATSAQRLFKRLIRVASMGGSPAMKTLDAVLNPDLDVLALFTASLCQEGHRLKEIADAYGVDADAFQAVAGLVPVPFLQACHRRWAASLPRSWVEGYCPLCGSWPAFAEVRGIERSRHWRCGRCGAEWYARALCCPYCAVSDHKGLVAFVPGDHYSHAVIDACTRCHGYVKTFTRLQGCPSDAVMIEDLASVALDVAALEQGFTRPPDAGYHLGVTVTDHNAKRPRFFAWNA
jgi:FdhE protein